MIFMKAREIHKNVCIIII